MTYAIVDIETTGGYAAANGIVEVSIKIFDGEKIIEDFETLINPGRVIPKYIRAFTGITDEMVQDQPRFEDVAEKIYTILQGNVFVAHNVNFDYSFLKAHLAECGYNLNVKKLCTVRLARQIFPGFASYSLGNLCHSLDIDLKNRHRAGGDAEATVILFKKLIDTNHTVIENSLNRNSKEQLLPPHVPKKHFEVLPKSPGVYYFHDNKDKVIYVGMAKNIKQRVNSHFSNNSDSRQKQNFLKHTYSISYQPTPTELMAAILESTEIKRLWPVFNSAQKKPEEVFGIFVYEDQNGYMRLAIEKKRKSNNPVYTFHYKVDGHGVLKKLIQQFSLCPKLCFIQTNSHTCSGIEENYCKGACEKHELSSDYNIRVLEAILSLTQRPSYVVLDKGLSENELSCIMVLQGSFFGMGYIPKSLNNITKTSIQEYIKPYKENSYIRNLLQSFSNNFPENIRHLFEV